MKHKDFKIIANYLNEESRNIFNAEEVKENIRNYWIEYKASKAKGKPTATMIGLCEALVSDMDYMDYVETMEQRIEHMTIDDLERILTEQIEKKMA